MPTVTTPTAIDPVLDARIFWDRHRGKILLGLLLVLATIAAITGYYIYMDRHNATASEAMAAAKTAPDFQKVIAQFPNTPAAGDAYLLLAEQQRNGKNFSEANKTLQEFIDRNPKHQLVTTARMAMAANLESLGRNDEALSAYQHLAASYPQSFNAPLALLSQIHLFKQKNQIEEARRVCETVLTQYRDSFVAGEATRQLRLLKPPRSAAGPVPPPPGQPPASPGVQPPMAPAVQQPPAPPVPPPPAKP